MAKKPKKPVIVAELGRPETPAETAARKARDSYLYKKRKTVNNLVFSLLVTLGLVAVIVFLVPRGTGDYLERNVAVTELAKDATTTAGQPLAAPNMGTGWLAKQAKLRFSKEDLTTYWYIGYTTPKVDYAAVMQGYTAEGKAADQRWVARMLERKKATGTAQFAGHTWQVYDHRGDSPDNSNVLFAYVTKLEHSTLIISGTASKKALTELAQATISSLKKAGQ